MFIPYGNLDLGEQIFSIDIYSLREKLNQKKRKNRWLSRKLSWTTHPTAKHPHIKTPKQLMLSLTQS